MRSEVTSVKSPILSLAALGDAGWRLGHQGDLLVLRRGDLSLQVDRVDNVYWLFGLEGLGKAKPDLVADRVCGLDETELERQQVRRPECCPRNTTFTRGRTGARAHTPSCLLVVRDLREVFWLGRSSSLPARRS